jgi:dCTP deaminase
MFLSAEQIREAVGIRPSLIQPFDASFLKPASYVLRFSDRWREWQRASEPIDVWSAAAATGKLAEPTQSTEFLLHPGTFVLAATLEQISFPASLMGFIMPLSHLARFGMSIHLGASLVSPGFGDHHGTSLTLEVSSLNPSPLRIRAGQPACHLIIAQVEQSSVPSLQRSIYEGDEAPTPPRLFEEFERVLRL